MGWTRKDLVTMRELEPAEIVLLVDTAASLQEIAGREIKKVPALRGKTIVNLFYENSTRTRTSFEIAGKWLSADVINFSAGGSSAAKGESFIDTAKNIAAMSPDVVVVRHSSAGAASILARELTCSVVNAGDGAHEHPTQALLDLLTIREHKGHFEGLSVAIVGDIAHSRVARSNIHAMRKLGMTVTVAGPPTLIPPFVQEMGVKVSYRLEDAIRDVDVDHDAAAAAGADDRRAHPLAARVFALLGADARQAPRPRPPRRADHAPRPGEPRGRALPGGRRRPLLGHPRSGDQGCRRAHGGAVPAGRQQGRRSGMSLLIQNGRVVDPVNSVDAVQDVLIDGDRIAARRARADRRRRTRTVLDATGKIVCPGFIDIHVHLREPGLEYKETVASGTRAAAAGGFTAVCCMANTQPVNDNRAVTDYIRAKAATEGIVRVYPIGAVTRGLGGKELAELAELAEAGCVAFSDDGRCVMNAALYRRAMEYTLPFGAPVISHAEDHDLSRGTAMNEGVVSTELGIPGAPAAAEDVMVARDILLAELTGAHVHIAHLSTSGAVRLVRDAKARGVRVTAEVTPHHLLLTDEAVRGFDTNTKMNPAAAHQA